MGTNTALLTAENKIKSNSSSEIYLEEIIEMPEILPVEKIKSQGISTKDIVTLYFKDTPILIKIAGCESTFKHLDKNGKLVRGRVNNQDVGVMQINERYHLEQSKSLGFDIYTLDGNMAYAKYLYEKQGSQPWNSSSKCWKRA